MRQTSLAINKYLELDLEILLMKNPSRPAEEIAEVLRPQKLDVVARPSC